MDVQQQMGLATTNRTRAEEQRHIDDLYMQGKLERDEWIKKTDELSDIQIWGPEGRKIKQS